MTIQEAIETVDLLKPNQYEFEQKVDWLSVLDGKIFLDVIATHRGSHIHHFDGYENADPDTELLVRHPYDHDIYVYYLQSMIDKENGETAKYNNSAEFFNQALTEFTEFYNRTHMPISRGHFIY